MTEDPFIVSLSYVDPSRWISGTSSENILYYHKLTRTLKFKLNYDPIVDYKRIYNKGFNLETFIQQEFGSETLRIFKYLWILIQDWKKYQGPFKGGRVNGTYNGWGIDPPTFTLYRTTIKSLHKDLHDWFLGLEIPPEHHIGVLEESIGGPLFVPLLRRFSREGMNLAPETLKWIIRGLLIENQPEGIREISKLYPNRPRSFSEASLAFLRTLEMAQALEEALGISRKELRNLFTQEGTFLNEKSPEITLETLKFFLEDLGVSPKYILRESKGRLDLESLEYLLEIVQTSSRNFLQYILWDLLNSEGDDSKIKVFFKYYPNLTRGAPLALSVGNVLDYYSLGTLNLSTSLRARSFLDLCFGEALEKELIIKFFKPEQEMVFSGNLYFYPLLVAEILFRKPEIFENPLISKIMIRGLQKLDDAVDFINRDTRVVQISKIQETLKLLKTDTPGFYKILKIPEKFAQRMVS